jgi:hypothetical protein
MPVDYRIIVARRDFRYNDDGSVDKGSTGMDPSDIPLHYALWGRSSLNVRCQGLSGCDMEVQFTSPFDLKAKYLCPIINAPIV